MGLGGASGRRGRVCSFSGVTAPHAHARTFATTLRRRGGRRECFGPARHPRIDPTRRSAVMARETRSSVVSGFYLLTSLLPPPSLYLVRLPPPFSPYSAPMVTSCICFSFDSNWKVYRDRYVYFFRCITLERDQHEKKLCKSKQKIMIEENT